MSFDLHTEWWHTFVYGVKNQEPHDHIEDMHDMEVGNASIGSLGVTILDVMNYIVSVGPDTIEGRMTGLLCWRIAAFMLYEEKYGEYK